MPDSNGGNQRFDSWKEIAQYLNRDVRTVIRWEKKRGLPIHRVPGGQRNVIFAYEHELAAWLVSQDGERLNSALPNQATEEQAEDQSASAFPDSKFVPISEDSTDITTRSVRANRWKLVTVAALVVTAGSIGTWLTHSHRALSVRNFVQLTDDGRVKNNLRTDGARLYFNEFEVNREVLMSSPVDGGPIRPIETSFSNVDLQDMSNNGQRLLVTSFEGTEEERPLWIMPAQGGKARRVGDVLCHFARWSPDNKSIACISGTRIIILDPDTFRKSTVGAFPSAPTLLAWSRDSRRMRLVVEDKATRAASTWGIDLDRDADSAVPTPSRLSIGQNCCNDWAWTQSGANFVYTRTDSEGKIGLFVRLQDAQQRRWAAAETKIPVKIGRVLTFAPGNTDNSLYVLVQNSSRGELLKFDSKRSAFQTIFHGLSAVLLAFSRDGQWMTYTNTVDNSLWRSRADGTEKLQLTHPPMDVQLSAWSPDGRRIAFMGKQPGKPWRIFLIDRDGGIPEEAAQGDDDQGAPTWSPDGKALTYANVSCQETQACWVRRVDLMSKTEEVLPGSHGFRTARWSPNGKYIAALQPETHELMLFDVGKQRWTVLADSITGDDLSWSGDSQSIYAGSPQGAKPVIEQVRIRDKRRVTIVSLSSLQSIPGQMGFWFGLTPDNSPILFHRFTASEVYSLEWVER